MVLQGLCIACSGLLSHGSFVLFRSGKLGLLPPQLELLLAVLGQEIEHIGEYAPLDLVVNAWILLFDTPRELSDVVDLAPHLRRNRPHRLLGAGLCLGSLLRVKL